MSLWIAISILVRIAAAGLTCVIAYRSRDRRVLLLAVLILLMAYRQGYTQAIERDGFRVLPFTFSLPLDELPGLAVSALLIPALLALDSLLSEHRRRLAALELSEERLRACIENTPNVAVQWYDEEGRVVYWNKASEATFGWTRAEALGKRLNELNLSDEDEATFRASLLEIKKTQRSIGPAEFRFARRDGSTGICLSTVFMIPMEQGAARFVCMDVDISRQKRAESEIRRTNDLLSTMVDTSPLGVVAVNDRAEVQIWNAAAELIVGIPAAQILHAKIPVNEARGLADLARVFDDALMGAANLGVETRLNTPDGVVRIIRIWTEAIRGETGRVVGAFGMIEDMTASRAAERIARESEDRLLATIEATQVGHWEWEPETNWVFLSPQWMRQLGYDPGELPQSIDTWDQLLHPEDRERAWSAVQAFRENPNDVFQLDFRLRHKDGTYRWLLSRGIAAPETNERASYVRGVNLDISILKHTEAALRESEARFRGIADNGSVGIWQITPDFQTVYANAAMCRMLEVEGEEELKQFRVHDFYDEAGRAVTEREMVRRVRGEATTYEIELIGRRGGRRTVIICGVPFTNERGEIIGAIGTFTDITALKQAERELAEGRARFAGIVESAMDGIVTVDDDHRIVLFNSAAEKMFAISAASAIGKNIETFIPARFRATHAAHIQAFRETGITSRRMGALGSISGLRASGEEFPIEASISQMNIGGRNYFTVILRDISERVKQEQALRESEAFLTRAQEVAKIGSWRSDPAVEGRLQWSDGCYRILGLSTEEFDERLETFFSLVHPDDRELVAREFQASIRGEKRYSVDHRIIRPDGAVRWLREEADFVRDADGRPIEAIGVCLDITERKMAEEAIREREERYRALVSALTSIVWTSDADGRFVEPQFSWQSFTGQTWEQHRGWGWFEAIHHDDRERVLSAWRDAIANGTTYESDGLMRHAPSDSYHYFNIRAVPLRNSDGTIREWVGTVTDIDDRKRAEQAVLAAKQALLDHQSQENARIEAELARLRDELVLKTRLATIGQVSASIAHELRNPLGAVRNAAYFLKRRAGDQDDKLSQYLSIIEQEVETSERIISNLMEMTRAKEPEKQSVNLGEILDSIFQASPKHAGVVLRKDLRPDPFVVTVDPSQLRQVLSNLVTNALHELGEGGEIVVDARRTDDYDTILFRDSGSGIAADQRKRLFEPLFTTKAKGTGLGLTICRQIIEKHGGAIEYHDDGRPGAAFLIRLPRAS